MRLRRNVKTGEVALACPYCDVEERGGGKAERKAIDENLKRD
jgi:hypothetical protein